MKKIDRSTVARLLPERAQDAHKGTFGRVLVIAGSREMCGAGLLCAKSALKAGAGLVYWALPKSMQPAFAAALPEVITLPLPETKSGELARNAWPVLARYIKKFSPSLAVVGPGMGKSPLLPPLLEKINLPLVLDGDALNACASFKKISFKNPVIFTSHPGEMARLLQEKIALDAATRERQTRQLIAKKGGVCVLKGYDTIVGVEMLRRVFLRQNTTGGPALAKGGSGDVLSGIIAGLWSQLGTRDGFDTTSAFQMAVCAVYIHGLAGDLAGQANSTYSVLATDIIAYLSAAFKDVLKEK